MIPRQVDRLLFFPALGLLAVSVMTQLFLDRLGGHYGVLQLIWALLGLIVFYFVALGIDEADLKRFAVPGYLFSVASLALVLVVGTGPGSNRWFRMGPVSFQPSEFGKPALALMLAWIASKMGGRTSASEMWLAMSATGGCVMLLVFAEPDLGTAVLYGVLTVGAMLGIPRIRWKHIVALGFILALVGTAGFFSLKDYQRQRIIEFVEGKRGTAQGGYQVAQALIVFGSGGWMGQGFSAESLQVVRYLPARRTDFVMATAGHFFGFAGSLLVIALLFWIPVRMFWIRGHLESEFAASLLLHTGILMMAQTTINLGVALNMLPVTGIPLPLMSYGGSGILSTMLGLGMVSPFAEQAMEIARLRVQARQADTIRPRLE
ncbi:MAG: FtsW/RodA/SpoVE family cell cycle protein [bacterium JZ-2024 1]